MKHPDCKQKGGDCRSPKLAVFPLDQTAAERLAQNLSTEQIDQSRLAKIAWMMSLLETVHNEINRMDAIAKALDHPASPQLIKAIGKTREAASSLYITLGDTFKWV